MMSCNAPGATYYSEEVSRFGMSGDAEDVTVLFRKSWLLSRALRFLSRTFQFLSWTFCFFIRLSVGFGIATGFWLLNRLFWFLHRSFWFLESVMLVAEAGFLHYLL